MLLADFLIATVLRKTSLLHLPEHVDVRFITARLEIYESEKIDQSTKPAKLEVPLSTLQRPPFSFDHGKS